MTGKKNYFLKWLGLFGHFKKATEKNEEFSHDPVVTIGNIEICKQPAKRAHVFPDCYIHEEGNVGAYTARGFLVQSLSNNI